MEQDNTDSGMLTVIIASKSGEKKIWKMATNASGNGLEQQSLSPACLPFPLKAKIKN
jgi:hypothetical protein